VSASLEDLLDELPDLIADAESIVDDLRTAETVETAADLRANLENAQTMLTDVQRRIKATLEAAAKP
jgi:hypothetical protein